VTHSRRSPRAAEKARERLIAFRNRKRAEEAASATPTPQHSAAFDAAYSSDLITPEAAQWDDRGYMRWTLPVHTITHIPRRAYIPRLTPNH
jgi:hypothetical protein